jgi:hypothetical protein
MSASMHGSTTERTADIPKTHRILDPVLGGGALLDLGPYPLIWALLFLYENPKNEGRKPTTITGSMIKTPLTGVDSSTSFTVAFGEAHAVLSCNITLPAMSPCVVARFRNGARCCPMYTLVTAADVQHRKHRHPVGHLPPAVVHCPVVRQAGQQQGRARRDA